MDNDIKLTEKEKYALYQCDDGLGWKEFIANKKLGISEKEAKEILEKLKNLGLIIFDPYKEKDLRIYNRLETEEEIKKFKRKNPPSFYTTEKGKKYLFKNPYLGIIP